MKITDLKPGDMYISDKNIWFYFKIIRIISPTKYKYISFPKSDILNKPNEIRQSCYEDGNWPDYLHLISQDEWNQIKAEAL